MATNSSPGALEKGMPIESITTPDSPIEASIVEPRYGQPGFWTRIGLTPQSFRRDLGANGGQAPKKSIKSRHLHMIAMGGCVGAGLFVGTGSALAKGGPLALLVAFLLITVLIINVVYALGELAVMYPVSGSFYSYSSRFIDPSWGFAMGWNYTLAWALAVPLELTVCAITASYWDFNVSKGLWIGVFLIIICTIGLFGAIGYGEEEFWSAFTKVTAVTVFLVVALVCICGGGPATGKFSSYIGAASWYDPGALANGAAGIMSAFVTAAFALAGTELVGMAAAETPDPAKSLPRAAKLVFWRCMIFYVTALLFVGFLVPWNDDRLLSSGHDAGTKASPFVIVAVDSGIKGLDHFFNIVILISVVSVGVSGVFGGSRTLTALAQDGWAPKIFAHYDQAGRPLWSTLTIMAFGTLAFISLSAGGVIIFEWLLAISGLSALFSWGSICLAHIRFRKAWKYHGHSLDEIPFKAPFGVWGSWVGLSLVVLLLIAQFYVAIFPVGREGTAEGFFKAYLSVPIVILFWFVGYIWKGKSVLKIYEIDVDSQRREFDWSGIESRRTAEARYPAWKRVLNLMI